MKKKRFVITFLSTHQALKAETVLKKRGRRFQIIAPPREFSSNCGIALCMEWGEHEGVVDILKQEKIEIDATHEWTVK